MLMLSRRSLIKLVNSVILYNAACGSPTLLGISVAYFGHFFKFNFKNHFNVCPFTDSMQFMATLFLLTVS